MCPKGLSPRFWRWGGVRNSSLIFSSSTPGGVFLFFLPPSPQTLGMGMWWEFSEFFFDKGMSPHKTLWVPLAFYVPGWNFRSGRGGGKTFFKGNLFLIRGFTPKQKCALTFPQGVLTGVLGRGGVSPKHPTHTGTFPVWTLAT